MTLLLSVLTIMTLFACGENPSPTEVAKAFVESLVKGDTQTTKKLLSKKALKKYEEVERQQGVPISKLLQENLGVTSPDKCHGEKVVEERATVECESASGPLSVPLVEEDDGWKIQPPFADRD